MIVMCALNSGLFKPCIIINVICSHFSPHLGLLIDFDHTQLIHHFNQLIRINRFSFCICFSPDQRRCWQTPYQSRNNNDSPCFLPIPAAPQNPEWLLALSPCRPSASLYPDKSDHMILLYGNEVGIKGFHSIHHNITFSMHVAIYLKRPLTMSSSTINIFIHSYLSLAVLFSGQYRFNNYTVFLYTE